MLVVDCKGQANWLTLTLEAIRHEGGAVVTGVVTPDFVAEARDRMYRVQTIIANAVGKERLERAGEMGVLRLIGKYDPFFFRFLELPELRAVVDKTVSDTAVLHLQNGFILPSFPPGHRPDVFQNRFHMDFPRVMNGYLVSINLLFAVDAFTAANGGTLFVPGTHQRSPAPDLDYLKACAVAAECPPGSMLVFDSTLWHAAGANVSGKDRLGINHQFTRSYVKQQIDYVRALGGLAIQHLPERTQQMLGYYTRVVTNLDEYYQPEHARLYRRGQG